MVITSIFVAIATLIPSPGALQECQPSGCPVPVTCPPVVEEPAEAPSVKIDAIATGGTIGGSFTVNYTWANCTGAAKVKVVAVQNNVEVGSAETNTTQAGASQVNKLVTTTAASGTNVDVTVYVYDAGGNEIKKSTVKSVKVK